MKRIIAIILSMCMLFSMANVFAAETETTITESYSEELALLTALGIVDSSVDLTKTVSRGEFVCMMTKLTKMDGTKNLPETAVFYDVLPGTKYYDEIMTAYKMGIVSGDGYSNFYAEKAVDTYGAVKMLICALGLGDIALVNGGYPMGYIRTAQAVEIDVPASKEALTYADVVSLIYEALLSPGQIESYYADGSVKIKFNGDSTYLQENFDIVGKKGVVTDTESTLKLADKISEGLIGIDSVNYNFSGDTFVDVNDLLGKAVIYFYNIETKEVVAVSEDSKRNTTVVIEIEDIKTVASDIGGLTYWNENDKEVTAKFSDTADIFYNNKRTYDITAVDFKPEEGSVKLIDNDGDRRYDYVFIESYEYMVVARSSMERLVSQYDSSVIEIPSDDSIIFYKNGFEIKTDNIGEWDILKIMFIKGAQKGIIEVEGREVTGTVTKKTVKDGKTILTVDETDYEVAQLYIDAYESNKFKATEPKVKQKYTFKVGDNNKIFAVVSSSSNEFEYGYLVGVSDGSGLDKMSQMKIYSTLGSMNIYDCADNMKVNNVKITNGAKEHFLDNYGRFKDQLVMYKLDGDGKVKEVKKAVDERKSMGGNGWNAEEFSLDHAAIGTGWSGNNGRSEIEKHSVDVLGMTPMFFVPADRSNDEGYTVYPAYGNIQVFDQETTDLEIYDLQKYVDHLEYYKISAVVVYERLSEADTSQSPYSINSMNGTGQPDSKGKGKVIVKEVVEELGYNDEPMYKLIAETYYDGTEFTAYIDENAYNADTESEHGLGYKRVADIESGDILKVAYKNPFSKQLIVDRFVVYNGPDLYADLSYEGYSYDNNYDNPEQHLTNPTTMYIVGEVVYVDEASFILRSKNYRGEDEYFKMLSSAIITYEYSISRENWVQTSYSLVGAGDRVMVIGSNSGSAPGLIIKVVE